jgi:hypothetical protein
MEHFTTAGVVLAVLVVLDSEHAIRNAKARRVMP